VSGLSPAIINGSHGLLSVCLDITHSYNSDLDVKLIAPDGTTVLLFSGIGGGDDNFTGTCLNDSAAIGISNANAPFTGTFIPMDILGNVNNGQNGNGNWTLKITDTYPVDAGTLLNWSLEFGNNPSAPFVMDSSNLPLVLINTNGQTIVNEPKINAGMKIIDNGPGNYNHITDVANVYDGNIGIEIRGSYSASLPQKPFGFETRDALGNNLDVSLLGMPSENDWILFALYNDKVFMRNALAHKLFELSGHYATRSRFCEVMINNSYNGMYLLMEKIKRDNDRVDIAKLDADDNAGDSLTGGYIIKIDYHDANNSWLSSFSPVDHTNLDVHFVYEYPDQNTITTQQKLYIQSFMASFETALYSSHFTESATGYRAWMDVPSFIDYFIVNEVSRNNDGFKKSWYMSKDKDSNDQRLNFGPVWDFDWAWKNVNECSIFAATDGSGWSYKINDCDPDVNSPGWAVRLMQDSTFTHQLNCRYFKLRQTILDTAYLFSYIDSVHMLVEQAQARHYRKWPILGINVGTPEIGSQPTTYDGEILKFKSWISDRLAWLDANMPGSCPDLSVPVSEENSFVRVFPNPTIDIVFVESGTVLRQIELFDITGRRVLFSEMRKSSAVIDLGALQNGVYILKYAVEGGSTGIQKIIKE
jgi:subtilisin-like proprotein convertase family protein